MEKKPLILRWPGIISVLALLILSVPNLSAQPRTAPPRVTNYTIMVIEGQVLLRRFGAQQSDPAQTNQALFKGDVVQVGPRSRLTIRRADQSTFRFDENTQFEVREPKTPAQQSTTV